MQTVQRHPAVSALSLAVRAALALMCAAPLAATAADQSVDDLVRPSNSIELGVDQTSIDSAKFGEYNGRNKEGSKLIGNFKLIGGDAYGGDGRGTLRWGLSGTDLGSRSRSLSGSIGSQGQWQLGFMHDQLTHQISDTYQTHLIGSPGGNVFTVAPTFGTVLGVPPTTTPPTPVTLDATQRAQFHNEPVSTTRKNTAFTAGLNIDRQLRLQFDFNHLDQSGAKLLGSGALGGIAAPAGSTWRAEAVALLLNPTQYKTDTFNLGLHWNGDKGHLSAALFSSVFRDAYESVSWQNVQVSAAAGMCASGGSCTYQTNTMSTAPNNRFQQLNLSGGYAFSPATHLAGGLSYGSNVQDATFLTGLPEIVTTPGTLLDGKVITRHADLKLTHQASRQLGLSAGFKFNERDNQSSSRNYQFWAINSATASATNTVDQAANAPYSNRRSELELAGDYRISPRQNLRASLEHANTRRWCNTMANGFNNCLVSPANTEDTLGLKYRIKADETLNLSLGYSHARRKADFDHDAVTPLSGLDTTTPTDVNAQDYPGFIAYVYGSRRQDTLKAGATWRAADSWEFGINGRYTETSYTDSTLGVQFSRSTALNFDSTYSYGDSNTVSAYLSLHDGRRLLRSGGAGAPGVNTAPSAAQLVAPTNIWFNSLIERGDAIGLNTRHQMMGGKFELVGDLSYAHDRSAYSTEVGYTLASCSATVNTSCGTLPDISNRVTTLKLTGTYALDRSSRIALGYVFQQRRTDDYYYYTTMYGTTANRVMPTNEQAPNYTVNVVGVSYLYSFR